MPRNVHAQSDWLRINFVLFKLAEQLVQQPYQSQLAAKDITQGDTSYLSHLFDLYKIQLYFLMLVQKFAKYIEVDTVEFFGINFLSDMPERTEKGEFNCILSHTLVRMFSLAKKCSDVAAQTDDQLQICTLQTNVNQQILAF